MRLETQKLHSVMNGIFSVSCHQLSQGPVRGKCSSHVADSNSSPTLASIVRKRLIEDGKLEEAHSLEFFFTKITEKEALKSLEQNFLQHLQDQVQTEIKKKNREIMELMKK